MLVDSHCHLDYPGLAEEEDAVVARARAAGVGVMQTIGTRLTTFDRTLAVARRHAGVFCSIGVHPHEAGEEGIEDEGILLARTDAPEIIGIGESGLDYFYDKAPRDRQAASFRAHIRAARASGLPLIVHTRDADADTMAILEEEMGQGAFTGVIHCFSSGRELAERATRIGFCLGLGGMLTFRSAEAIRDIVRDMPRDKLILETDSPYLAPVPMRGKCNEPAFVAHVAVTLAKLLDVSVAEVERLTTANFFRLFTRARLPDPAAWLPGPACRAPDAA